jgi:hypothetical protein
MAVLGEADASVAGATKFEMFGRVIAGFPPADSAIRSILPKGAANPCGIIPTSLMTDMTSSFMKIYGIRMSLARLLGSRTITNAMLFTVYH